MAVSLGKTLGPTVATTAAVIARFKPGHDSECGALRIAQRKHGGSLKQSIAINKKAGVAAGFLSLVDPPISYREKSPLNARLPARPVPPVRSCP